jgi:hypothetical protein
LKNSYIKALAYVTAISAPLGCSTAPDEPAPGSAAADAPLTPPAAAPNAGTLAPADVGSTLNAAARLVDPDDQLPVSDPVFALLDGVTYAGDASIIVTQAASNHVSLRPGSSERAVAQEDTVDFAVTVTTGGRQLAFSVPLTEADGKALFSQGSLALPESRFGSVLEHEGQQVFRVVSLAYKRSSKGVDQITASFAAIGDGEPLNVPSQVTIVGTVRLTCMPAAPAGGIHTSLDDPMLRSPFCQTKVKSFGLRAFAP